MAKKASAGRPPESPNRKYDIVEAAPTACRVCGSTERSPYDARVDRNSFQNTHVNPTTGREFNVVEYRNTKCLKCGQWRRDRTEVLEDRDS